MHTGEPALHLGNFKTRAEALTIRRIAEWARDNDFTIGRGAQRHAFYVDIPINGEMQ